MRKLVGDARLRKERSLSEEPVEERLSFSRW